LVAAAIVVVAVAPGADAGPETGSARAGAHHGTWNGVFATTRGNCSSGYSVPFTVTGCCVSSAGGGSKVSGTIGRGGGVAVNVKVGASQARGGSRMVGSNGAGAWSGIISGGRCTRNGAPSLSGLSRKVAVMAYSSES
jgi:hypothetical protein